MEERAAVVCKLNVVAAAVVCFRYYLRPTPEGRMLMIGMLIDFVATAPGAPPFAATVAAAAAHKQPPVRLAVPAPNLHSQEPG